MKEWYKNNEQNIVKFINISINVMVKGWFIIYLFETLYFLFKMNESINTSNFDIYVFKTFRSLILSLLLNKFSFTLKIQD